MIVKSIVNVINEPSTVHLSSDKYQQDLHSDEIYLQHIIRIMFIYKFCTKKICFNYTYAYKYKNNHDAKSRVCWQSISGSNTCQSSLQSRFGFTPDFFWSSRLLEISLWFYPSSVIGPFSESFNASPGSPRGVRRCTEELLEFEVAPGARSASEHLLVGTHSHWLRTRFGRFDHRRQ